LMNYSHEKQSDRIMLAMDTATATLTVAAARGGRLLGERNSHGERNHSMFLLPAIRELLESLGVTPRDLGGIAVGRGPGSYTGVRIGVSAAKTMAWSLGLPVYDVSTLEAMALGGLARCRLSGREPVWVVPLLDARRGQVFTGCFAAAGPAGDGILPAGWMRLAEDGIRPMDRWTGELKGYADQAGRPPGILAFVGEVGNFAAQTESLAASWPGTVEVLEHEVRAADTARLAYPRVLKGQPADLHRLVPNYTQLAEAEAKLLAKRGRAGR